ncbi:hypothetical protein L7F22_032594 [Adiantum nelumboides]|nr:hypothetical protein [Adiantum nelumboides]
MMRNMETSDGSLEGGSDSDEDFHSASDSPNFHGGRQTSAALFAVQLALVCVRLHQCARKQNGISGIPLYPVGLTPLKKRRKQFPEALLEGELDHSSDSLSKPLVEPSIRAFSEGGYQQLWTKSCSSSTPAEESSIKKRSWVTSDGGYGYALRQLPSKKVLQRASSQEHQPKQSQLNREVEAIQDGENLDHRSILWQDRGSGWGVSDQKMVDAEDYDDDDTRGKGYKYIMDVDKLKGKKLADDLQPSSMSLSNLLKASSNGTIFPEQNMGGPWSSDSEITKADDRSLPTEKSSSYDSSQASFFPRNVATIPNSKAFSSNEREDAPENANPEQGQLNSLLLWPVGLAVEAISFQVRLIAQAFSLVAILYDWCNSFASNRVRETWQAKERATEALSQKVAMISNVPPKVTESGSMVLKRAGWGCFAAVYVCILLSMLLFPTLLLDYVFLSKVVEEPVNIIEPLHFDYTLPQPAAVVSLCPIAGGKLKSHSELGRPIPVSHKVHITVLLTLPESDYNRELGMFQLSAELLSETSEVIKSSSRPCMLRFHSLPIRMLKTFLISLPSLLGMFTESQTLVVHLMELEEQRVATGAVRILVQPKAGMPLGQGIPEIYSAHVHIETHLPWLKNFMHQWKWTVYIWTGVMLYMVKIIMILCCCRQALMPKAWVGQNDESRGDELGSLNVVEMGETGPGNQLQKAQVSNRHRSLHEPTPIARAVLKRREGKLTLDGHTSM